MKSRGQPLFFYAITATICNTAIHRSVSPLYVMNGSVGSGSIPFVNTFHAMDGGISISDAAFISVPSIKDQPPASFRSCQVPPAFVEILIWITVPSSASIFLRA